MKTLIYISILFMLVAACKKDEQVTEMSEPGGFHSIEINSAFTIILVEDVSCYVEVKGNASFADACEIYVADSVLYLSCNAKNKWTHPSDNALEIIVHSPPLKLVTANETSFITTSTPITSNEFGLILKSKANEADLNLNCPNFYYWNNFPTGGMLTLHGQVHDLKLWNTAIMTIDARDLIAQYALVENNSKADCIVTVSQGFQYKITDKGNIHLYGQPVTIEEVEHTGSGALIEY